MKCHVCGQEITGSYIEHMKTHKEKAERTKPLIRVEITGTPFFLQKKSELKEKLTTAILEEERDKNKYDSLADEAKALDDIATFRKLKEIADEEKEHSYKLREILTWF